MAWSEAARAQHGRPHDDRQYDLTDAERALTAPLIPRQGRMGRPRATDPRRVFDGPCRRRGAGGVSFRPVIRRFPQSGTVSAPAATPAGRGVAPTAAIVDSRSVKTTEGGGPSGHDAGRKIRGRKRHIAVDAEGSPIVVHVHPADVQDRDGAPDVIVDLLNKAGGSRRCLPMAGTGAASCATD